MTSQEKKEYLRQYLILKAECDGICDDIEQLHSEYMQAKAIQYDDMPKAHNSEHDLSDLIVKVEEQRTRFYDSLSRCIAKRAEIRQCIDQLENPYERRVLILRYIYGQKWAAIAIDIGYEERHVYRIHGSALASLSVNVSKT